MDENRKCTVICRNVIDPAYVLKDLARISPILGTILLVNESSLNHFLPYAGIGGIQHAGIKWIDRYRSRYYLHDTNSISDCDIKIIVTRCNRRL